MPRSSTVSTTACSPGAIRYWFTSLRTPDPSMTPGRSLPPNTSGCSITPVASTISPARKRNMVSPWYTGTRLPS